MKLRNLMYATMIACAFASCSNDDVIPAPEQGAEGTFLDILIKDPVLTKANPDESDIKTLTAVVFDASGKIEAIETANQGKGTNSRKVALTPGEKSVIMIANYTLPQTVKVGDTYAALEALTNTRIEEVDEKGFSMSSKVYKNITIETNKTTYLGYANEDGSGNSIYETEDPEGVKLYRNVAKVVLKSVTLTNEKGDFKNMSNPNLKIEDVFILNAKATTKLVASDADKFKHWAPTQSDVATLLGGVAKDDSWNNTDKFLLGSEWDVCADLKTNVKATTIGFKGDEIFESTDAFKDAPFYVYENGSEEFETGAAKTLLVIKGAVIYDSFVNGETTRVEVPNRYYTIAVGRTGFEDGFVSPDKNFPYANRSALGINGASANKAYDVLRNLQYEVSLTIKGLGYDQPGGGDPEQFLDVNVQVVPFGTVSQDVEI